MSFLQSGPVSLPACECTWGHLRGAGKWPQGRWGIRSASNQKTFRYLLRFYSWFFRGFFVALFCLEKQCSGLFRYFFVAFSWPLFRANFTRTRPGTVFWSNGGVLNRAPFAFCSATLFCGGQGAAAWVSHNRLHTKGVMQPHASRAPDFIEIKWPKSDSKVGGRKTAQKKKQIPGNGGSQELFGPMFPWFCLFSLSFQWEEVQKFPGTLFLGTFFSYFRWFFSLWKSESQGRTPEWLQNDSKVGSGVAFESILGHFGVGLPESL